MSLVSSDVSMVKEKNQQGDTAIHQVINQAEVEDDVLLTWFLLDISDKAFWKTAKDANQRTVLEAARIKRDQIPEVDVQHGIIQKILDILELLLEESKDDNEVFEFLEDKEFRKEALKQEKLWPSQGRVTAAISGGGMAILGALSTFTALEAETGMSVRELFDVFVGTSSGGLLSLAYVLCTVFNPLSDNSPKVEAMNGAS